MFIAACQSRKLHEDIVLTEIRKLFHLKLPCTSKVDGFSAALILVLTREKNQTQIGWLVNIVFPECIRKIT